MSKVTDAGLKREIAGCAFSGLAGYTESRIEGAVRYRSTAIGVVFDIVESSL